MDQSLAIRDRCILREGKFPCCHSKKAQRGGFPIHIECVDGGGGAIFFSSTHQKKPQWDALVSFTEFCNLKFTKRI